MNTLLVLIDFHGHPDFTTDPTTDIVRYSNLTNIIFDRKLDRDKFRIYSTEIPKRDRKLFEIQEMSRKRGHQFYESAKHTISNIENTLGIDKTWQVIIGGTNTSGCVYNKLPVGAYHWHKAGYKTKIYLPICGEYEIRGINDFEKNVYGLTQLFKDMIKDNCLDIELVYRKVELQLPTYPNNKKENRDFVHDTKVSLKK